MLKKLQLIVLLILCMSSGFLAQEVVLSDEFDSGDGLWNSGWIDAGTTTVSVSIDSTGKLSGANSYKLAITNGGVEMWRIQRLANLPLVAGYQYTVSFMAVSDLDDAGINILFEINGSPYTKRLDDTATITTTPQTFSYTMTATEDVSINQVKFMFGSQRNSGKTIWIDKIEVTRIADPTIITQWGITGDAFGLGWPILNTAETAPGSASIGGYRPMDAGSNGASLRGGFSETLQPTTQEAVVVKGKMEFTGGDPGSVYTALRFAITYQDSASLQNQYTDSAKWVRNSTNQAAHYGYEITPKSGTTDYPNGGGGAGPVWTVINGNWASTYSNGGGPFGELILQAPRNAAITAGTYDWAVSVQQVNDTTNEVRWYLVKEDNSYWFAGTVLAPKVTDKFNNIAFWTKEGEHTQFNILDAQVDLGAPIDVPEAPWQPYYLDLWGVTGDAFGAGWPILNDSDYVVGNASIGGYRPMDAGSNGASVRGGFGQNIQIPADKAIILNGKMEFTGGNPGSVYTALRFAITYQDSVTLQNQYTDSAKWVAPAGKGHYGYEITPKSGTTDYPNGGGGAGPVWTVINGNWASTYSNGGGPFGQLIMQAPRNAEILEGEYDWAISVHQVNDSTNEVRWYIVKTDNKYWFGGSVLAPAVTDKFNSVAFWTKEGEHTQFNILDAQVDLGAPIVVPEAPWEPYYLDLWGVTGDAFGAGWPILNDSDYVVGNASIGGYRPMDAGSNGASVRGGFGQNIQIPAEKAVIVKGKMEFAGGNPGSVYTALRFALTYQDSLTLQYQYTDSAKWVAPAGKGHHGYEITPRSGTTDYPNGGGGAGPVWTVINGNWASTYSNGGGPFGQLIQQAPRNAEIIEGTYDWAISIHQVNDSTNEVRWILFSENEESYWFCGIVQVPAVTDKFNSVAFWTKEGEHTQFNILDAQVDLGTPIDIPIAPWEQFYISASDWGFFGDASNRVGGWELTPGDLDGNVSISGTAPVAANQWAAIRGGLGGAIDLNSLPPDTALTVTGKMEFVGGGFDGLNGLRFGLFYSDSAGVVDSTEYGPMWTGKDSYSSGYLISPNSGTNDNPDWGSSGKGSVGGVINSTWLSTDGANNYLLSNQKVSDVAGAGSYDFKLSFKAMGNSEIAIGYSIKSSSYIFEGYVTDNHSPLATTKFNSINFAVNNTNTSTTSLIITDVLVDLGSPIVTGIDNEKNTLPIQYSLGQNYPNPFNPTTTIDFALPRSGNVKLVVYDILGKAVAKLADGEFSAGYHKVTFNASNLTSGIYFYSIEAGDFMSVKKLMLLK